MANKTCKFNSQIDSRCLIKVINCDATPHLMNDLNHNRGPAKLGTNFIVAKNMNPIRSC